MKWKTKPEPKHGDRRTRTIYKKKHIKKALEEVM